MDGVNPKPQIPDLNRNLSFFLSAPNPETLSRWISSQYNRAVESAQWPQRHPKAGSSWFSWLNASQSPYQVDFIVGNRRPAGLFPRRSPNPDFIVDYCGFLTKLLWLLSK